MKFEATPLVGLYLLEPQVFGDARGFFLESWNAARFAEAGFDLVTLRRFKLEELVFQKIDDTSQRDVR